MIKAIIFDLNGVFIKGPNLSDLFQEKFGVPVTDFLSALKEILAKVRMPNAGDSFLYWQPYFEKWNLNLSRENFFDLWFNSEKQVPEMIELAKEIKNNNRKIIIFSNNFAERAAYYEKNFSFLRETFDDIFYSWQTGFVKPDQKAFENLFAKTGLRPEECLYFDDKQENIEMAQDFGIKSFLFIDPKETKKILVAEKIIDSA